MIIDCKLCNKKFNSCKEFELHVKDINNCNLSSDSEDHFEFDSDLDCSTNSSEINSTSTDEDLYDSDSDNQFQEDLDKLKEFNSRVYYQSICDDVVNGTYSKKQKINRLGIYCKFLINKVTTFKKKQITINNNNDTNTTFNNDIHLQNFSNFSPGCINPDNPYIAYNTIEDQFEIMRMTLGTEKIKKHAVCIEMDNKGNYYVRVCNGRESKYVDLKDYPVKYK